MAITKKEALMAIDREREAICNASDLVWDNPETAFLEYKSMEILCDLLTKEGFEVKQNVANIPTAFTGTFGSGKPVIGLPGYPVSAYIDFENFVKPVLALYFLVFCYDN